MFVKICGTTNLPDAELAVALGADAVGFIFAPSKRRVSVEQAAAITCHLPSFVARIGVFTAPDAPTILEAVQQAHLTAVQLHFPYDGGFIRDLRSALAPEVELWQVIAVEVQATQRDEIAENSPAQLTLRLREARADPKLDAVLLDATQAGVSGGLGVSFAWREVQAVLLGVNSGISPAASQVGGPRLIVAGGLHAGNVREAVATLRPWGVDVVSGVEARAGVKDPERLAAFLQAARSPLEDEAGACSPNYDPRGRRVEHVEPEPAELRVSPLRGDKPKGPVASTGDSV